MLYLYYGENKFLAKKEAKKELSQFEGEVFHYQAEEERAVDFFKKEALQGNIFSNKKAVIIDGLFVNNELADLISEKLEKLINSANYFFFVSNEKGIKSKKLFKELSKKKLTKEFKEFSFLETLSWIKKEVEARGSGIKERAANLLVEYTGNDLWRIDSELDKLINYKNGKPIEESDIQEMVHSFSNPGIFEVIDAFLKNNKEKSFSLVNKYLLAGGSPSYLTIMIAYQYRTLILVLLLKKSGKSPFEISQRLAINYYVAKKLWAAKTSFSKAKESYLRILKADLAIKKGLVLPQREIFSLVADILS